VDFGTSHTWQDALSQSDNQSHENIPLVLCVSVALLALTFAIQRYLIPIELLFGIAVWILTAYVLKSQHCVVAAMTICLIASLATLNAPDWGHIPSNPDTRNVFGMRVSPDLVSTPADYLVYGSPINLRPAILAPGESFFRDRRLECNSNPWVQSAGRQLDRVSHCGR
jgi:hypothetical protein